MQMTREEIFSELVSIMEGLFEIDPSDVTPGSRLFEDLELDSIDAVDMIVQIQKKTGRRFQPEDFKQVKTVGDVVDVLERLLAKEPEGDAS